MFVKNRMTVNTISVSPTATLGEARRIMKEHGFEGLPVTDGEHIVGVITMWDLLEAVAQNCGPDFLETTTVEKVMMKNVVTVNQDEIIEEAAFLMHKHDIDLLPVVDDYDNLVGVISQGDIFNVFVEMLGLMERGTRITVHVADKVGQMAGMAQIIKNHGVSIASMASFYRDSAPNLRDIVLRLKTDNPKKIVDELRKAGYRVTHVSQVWE